MKSDYLKIGFSIFPLGKITKDKTGKKKISYPVKWTKYQTKRATPEEVKKWDHENIGIATGKISGILVLDLDSYKSNYNKELVKNWNLPPTPTQQTASGGRQLFFKYPKGVNITNTVSLGGDNSGIDIRGDGGMVIAPPSKTNYGEYFWLIDPFENPLAEIPPKLLELLKSNNEDKKVDWDTFFKNTNASGVRNSTATQMAGKLLYELSPELWDTLGLVTYKAWNKEFNDPPLSDSELLTTWNSIKNKHIKNNKPPEEANEKADEEEKELVKGFIKDKTKGTFYLAKYLTKKYDIVTIGEKEREMFVYRDGLYMRAENEVIYPEIQRVLGHYVTKNAKNETFTKIADMTSRGRDIFDETDTNFIPLANGVYDLEKDELLPHDPKYRFVYKMPVIYNKKATCPKTEEFLGDILNPEQVQVVQEWLGYYFYRKYMFKKAIIFVGEGDTGKTTLLEVITNLLGRDNISSVSLQKMSSDKFAAAHLYRKHGNLVDELSAKDINDTGNFKVATGGGSISGEYKFGNQFSFNNFSKLTFACNKIPDVTDFDDEAYFNRWMVIRFEKTLTKKIPNFIERLKTEEERSGLFNFAMEGLRRLLENGQFSYGQDAMETKKEMMKSGSSIAIFAAEQLVQDMNNELTKEAMYDHYTRFCLDRGLPAETIKMLGTKLPFYATYVTDGRITTLTPSGKPTQVRGWRNVAFAEKEENNNDFNFDD